MRETEKQESQRIAFVNTSLKLFNIQAARDVVVDVKVSHFFTPGKDEDKVRRVARKVLSIR